MKPTKKKSKTKETVTNKAWSKMTTTEKIDDIANALSDMVDITSALTDKITAIEANLSTVNNNGQFACDKIEVIEVKLKQIAGRLGLWNI